jgi:hypothetical protein
VFALTERGCGLTVAQADTGVCPAPRQLRYGNIVANDPTRGDDADYQCGAMNHRRHCALLRHQLPKVVDE